LTLIDANNEAYNEANNISPKELLQTILVKIVKNPSITQNNLAEDLNVSRSTIQRFMDELKRQGKLERIDGTRGYWKVNQSDNK